MMHVTCAVSVGWWVSPEGTASREGRSQRRDATLADAVQPGIALLYRVRVASSVVILSCFPECANTS